MDPVEAYAKAVMSGQVTAGKYHKLACARHLRDLTRQGEPGFPYRFDWAQAERFLKFARLMKHYKGRQFAGQSFSPTPVQVFRLGSIFGWRHIETGYRRFTVAYNDLPRKHGKSFEGALVLLYATFYEGESGADGYCIATKERQARIVFSDMKKMIQMSGLSSRLNVNAWNVNHTSSSSKAEPLGSDSDTTDGLNPHVVVIDEVHAMKSRALIDVMESATGSRVNPLFFFITTHGDNMVSVWGDYLTYAQQILDGVLDDDPSTLSFFAFIAHADTARKEMVDGVLVEIPADDPFDEATWIKANPHYGVSVNPEDMRIQAAKAMRMPSAAKEFKTKRLNMLPEASSQWLSMEDWRGGQSTTWSHEDLVGRDCWVGIDLASKVDLCALVFLFPPVQEGESFRLLRWVWTPEATLQARAYRDRAPYDVWSKLPPGPHVAKPLIALPGKTIDHAVVSAVIVEQRSRFKIRKVGYDPWHSDAVVKDLLRQGFPENDILEVSQTFAGLSAGALRLEAEVLSQRIDAGGCPVMGWTFANAVVQKDGKDNIQPIKKRSTGRIDPVVATTIAMSIWIREPELKEPAYEMLVFGGKR